MTTKDESQVPRPPATSHFLEPDDGWLYDFISTLDKCRETIKVARAGATSLRTNVYAGVAAAEARALENAAAAHQDDVDKASPFIRQNNAIRKWVELRLGDKPGNDRHAVSFLAGVLDIKLSDEWLASQE